MEAARQALLPPDETETPVALTPNDIPLGPLGPVGPPRSQPLGAPPWCEPQWWEAAGSQRRAAASGRGQGVAFPSPPRQVRLVSSPLPPSAPLSGRGRAAPRAPAPVAAPAAAQQQARGLQPPPNQRRDSFGAMMKDKLQAKVDHLQHALDPVGRYEQKRAEHDTHGVVPTPAPAQQAVSAQRTAVLGPVIGMVQATTARVLFEFDFSGEVEVRLEPSVGGTAVAARRSVAANIPAAFSFSGLVPREVYNVKLPDDIACPVQGRVRTLTGSLGERPFNTAIVSCNKTQVVLSLGQLGKRDLWADLARRCKANQVDVIFHIGDQVYADEIDEGIEGGDPDSVFCKALLSLHQEGAKWVANKGAMLDKQRELDRGDSTWVIDGQVRPREDWERLRPTILESYRALYRAAWSHLPTRVALANACNVMLLDDHDISDDWGDRAFHRDPASPEFFIGEVGLQAYREYQRALRDDCDPLLRPFENEGFTVRWGDIGALCVDGRCPRSFRCPPNLRGKESDPPLIDSEQWQMMERALGQWTDVRHLMMVTPVPLALFSPFMTRLGAQFINDTAGQFAFAQLDDLIRLWEMLRKWKTAKPGREITLYSGDIHVGQHTDIFHRFRPVFKQLIASSIGNHGAGVAGRWVITVMQRMPGQASLGNGWKFKHHSMITAERNYGLSRCTQGQSPRHPPLVLLTHVDSDTCATSLEGSDIVDAFSDPVLNHIARSDKFRSAYRCCNCALM
eukprot:TRINITY_DN8045_c2_g2_i1.p1 TRINITY_DN8045_c2_g2~~TRINITY_DN8045_c2_g2_i1.p1  ORF type:complete len:736 (+),score=208.33 TRINITY_DN8045_c2_g2_i1:85-2292(+)